MRALCCTSLPYGGLRAPPCLLLLTASGHCPWLGRWSLCSSASLGSDGDIVGFKAKSLRWPRGRLECAGSGPLACFQGTQVGGQVASPSKLSFLVRAAHLTRRLLPLVREGELPLDDLRLGDLRNCYRDSKTASLRLKTKSLGLACSPEEGKPRRASLTSKSSGKKGKLS